METIWRVASSQTSRSVSAAFLPLPALSGSASPTALTTACHALPGLFFRLAHLLRRQPRRFVALPSCLVELLQCQSRSLSRLVALTVRLVAPPARLVEPLDRLVEPSGHLVSFEDGRVAFPAEVRGERFARLEILEPQGSGHPSRLDVRHADLSLIQYVFVHQQIPPGDCHGLQGRLQPFLIPYSLFAPKLLVASEVYQQLQPVRQHRADHHLPSAQVLDQIRRQSHSIGPTPAPACVGGLVVRGDVRVPVDREARVLAALPHWVVQQGDVQRRLASTRIARVAAVERGRHRLGHQPQLAFTSAKLFLRTLRSDRDGLRSLDVHIATAWLPVDVPNQPSHIGGMVVVVVGKPQPDRRQHFLAKIERNTRLHERDHLLDGHGGIEADRLMAAQVAVRGQPKASVAVLLEEPFDRDGVLRDDAENGRHGVADTEQLGQVYVVGVLAAGGDSPDRLDSGQAEVVEEAAPFRPRQSIPVARHDRRPPALDCSC